MRASFGVVVVALLVVACSKPTGPVAKVGDDAPTAVLLDSKGAEVDLKDAIGSDPIVVVVYRGIW